MRKFAMVMASGMLLTLVGCAGSGGNNALRGSSSFDDDADYAKMAQITNDALKRGYRIVWIHPPQKAKGPDRGQP